jgi:tRNA pseudouridine32 synthase/23S rRNA pseudouridine746 synthase
MAEAGWTPPPREGVAASRVGVPGRFDDVLQFLVARFPAVADWPARLARGDVLDAGGRALDATSPCAPGAVLWYWRDPPPEPRIPFELELLYRDERLVVVDKPHFLPVIPGGRHLHETALVRLRKTLGVETLAPMHRLDLDTAGVLVFTVQPATRHAYQSLLRDRQVHKVYEAVAPWSPALEFPLTCSHRLEQSPGAGFMQMRVVPGEPNAQTRVELIERIEPSAALYRLTPLTGRKHQLRAQMNALGLPIVGDRLYPALLPDAEPDFARPLQLLACEFAFVDPISGQPHRFVSRRKLSHAPPAAAAS